VSVPRDFVCVCVSLASPSFATDGPGGCGKSTHLLEAVVHAREKKWIVLYIMQGVCLCVWVSALPPLTF
jgi:hypothetical protein